MQGLSFQIKGDCGQIGGSINQQQCFIGQIVEQGGWLLVEIGKVELHASERNAGGQMIAVLFQLELGGGVTGVGIERLDSLGGGWTTVEHSFAARSNHHAFGKGIGQGALAGGIEATQAVHLIPPEFDAQGKVFVGRPDVDDAAPMAVCSRFFHQGFPPVPSLEPLPQQRLQVDDVMKTQGAQVSPKGAGRRCELHQCPHRADNNRRSHVLGARPAPLAQGCQSSQSGLSGFA